MLDDIFVKQGYILKSDWYQTGILGHYSQNKMASKMAVKPVFYSKEACFEFILPFNCTEMVISFGKFINLHQYTLYNHSSNVFTLLCISPVCNCKQKSYHIKRVTRLPKPGELE